MSTITDMQQVALDFAGTLLTGSTDLASNAIGYLDAPLDASAYWNAPEYIKGYEGWPVIDPSYITLPSITASRPDKITLNTITSLDIGTIPAFSVAEPVISMPTAPNASLPGAPTNAPTFNAPVLPSAPKITLPDVPTFTPIVIPAAPAAESVTFTEVLGAADILDPSERFSWSEQVYSSVLLDSLKAKLISDLQNGGYGIEPADEQGLWLRAAEREVAATELAVEEASRQAAARGFMLPPGALNATIAKAQQDALSKISSLQREIALKRADMYVENRKFTIEQVREVESMLITYYGYMMERALNAAKALVELGIASFNARLAKHNYLLERYKAAASVYEALIRGALLKLEQYKATVEGLRVSVETQRVYAEVYRTQIDGVNALINVYRTQVEAAKTTAEIESIKLQGYKTSVDAYAAQVQAKAAEFGMYESRIKGEVAKIEVYKSQVQAYTTRVDAYRTQLSAKEIDLRSQLSVNTQKLDVYKADLQRYSTELEKSQIELNSVVSKYDADVRAYGISMDANIRKSQQNIEAAKANADVAVSASRVASSFAIQAAQVLATKSTSSAQVMGSVASAYGAAAASALNSATAIEAHLA